MSRVDVELKAFVQTKHLIGAPGGDEMHGQVVFDATAEGKRTTDYRVDVKLVVGGTYEVDSIEVGMPAGHRGPFNHAAFAERVQAYIRGAVGKSGWAVRLGPGASNVTMTNCLFARSERFSFEASSDSGTW